MTAENDYEHRITVLETNYTYIKDNLDSLSKKLDKKFDEINVHLNNIEKMRQNTYRFRISITITIVAALIIAIASFLSRGFF